MDIFNYVYYKYYNVWWLFDEAKSITEKSKKYEHLLPTIYTILKRGYIF